MIFAELVGRGAEGGEPSVSSVSHSEKYIGELAHNHNMLRTPGRKGHNAATRMRRRRCIMEMERDTMDANE